MKKISLALFLLIATSTYLLPQTLILNPLKSQNVSAKNLVEQAKKDLNNAEYQTALMNLNQAIKIDPNYAEAYYYQGLIYGEYGTRKLIRNIPLLNCRKEQQQLLCTQISMFEKMQENRNQAIRKFDKAIDLNPNYAIAYYQRGLMQKDPKAQLKDWQKALNIYTDQGNSQLQLGNYQLASVNFKNSLDLSQEIDTLMAIPKKPSGYSLLKRKNVQQLYEAANRLFQQGNFTLAREKYKEAALILQENQNSQEYKRIIQIITQIEQTITKK